MTPSPATAAQRLLADFEYRFDVGEVPPVPVERIAMSLLQLDIDEADDLRQLPNAPADQGRLSGLLHVPTKTIWVDREESRRSPGRRRFTIGHELGHWCLHVGSKTIVTHCRPDEIVDSDDGNQGKKLRQIEAEANAFAGELLMPELLIRSEAPLHGYNLPALAHLFGVSVPALERRLRNLDLLPAWMVTR